MKAISVARVAAVLVSLVATGCTSVRTPVRTPSIEKAAVVVIQRVLAKQIFGQAKQIPICVMDQAGPIDSESVFRLVAAMEPRAKRCPEITAGSSQNVEPGPVRVEVRSIERTNGDTLVSTLAIGAACYVLTIRSTQ